MKKILIVAGIVVVLLVGGVAVWNIQLSGVFLDGEKEEVKVGDLVIPVTASGTVEPRRVIQIKSKASGQVARISVIEGQLVKAGETLVELDPVDEKRNVQAKQSDLDRTSSALEKAKVQLENLTRDLPLQTKLAQARLDDAQARLKDAQYQWSRVGRFGEQGISNEKEKVQTEAAFLVATAAAEVARIGVDQAKNNEELALKAALEDVKTAQAVHNTMEKALEEAKLRLEETTVKARSDGMVYRISVREGEVIQGGVNTLTGGTLLMVLADTSSMFVLAQVDEADIGEIRKIAPEFAKPGRLRLPSEDESRLRVEKFVEQHGLDAASGKGGAPATQMQTGADDLVGRPVKVTVEAYRSESYTGMIEQILPEPTRAGTIVSFNVRMRLIGDGLEKLLDLQADLEFTTEKKDDVLLVSNDSLHSEGRQCYVWVVTPPTRGKRHGEEKRWVRIGKTDGTFSEIIEGLKAEEEVWKKLPTRTAKEKEQEEAKS